MEGKLTLEERIARGRYLCRLRERRCYTMAEAAREMGICRSTLCRYEHGQIRQMSPEVRRAVCRVYRITPEQMEKQVLPPMPVHAVRDVRRRRLTEEEMMELYRELDLRQQMRVQFLLEQGQINS